MKNKTHQKKTMRTTFLMQIRSIAGIAMLCYLFTSCQETPTATVVTPEAHQLIPAPVMVTQGNASFEITPKTTIYTDEGDEELAVVAAYLAAVLRPATGFQLPLQVVKDKAPEKGMYLKRSQDTKVQHQEGYIMNIGKKLLTLEAAQPEGIFRGIQTLRQLLPDAIEYKTTQTASWNISVGTVEDYPQYSYRGAMLDVSRHFFPVEAIKRVIDLIAAYKMNTLHLHLSDDQGWRIEIKSWPKLTTYGGSTEVGGGEGGFYSQEDYKEIVAYAQSRYITIIPEIDMPGHTNAALASYPELNCDDKAPDLYTGTEVGFSSLCVQKEITYQFIDDVIAELAAITPGPYIHIGGDESHATDKDDYIFFINKVQDIVKKHGKNMIGWDEVQHAKLAPESVAQFWASDENALGAVKQNVKLIMSPARKAYLDMKYDSISPLGLHWAGYVEVDDGYNWDPATLLKGISKANILGVESPLWTETIETMDDIEYMVFPRLPGYAEIGWSQDSLRSWASYKDRLGAHYKRFKAMDINFYESGKVPWKKGE